MAQPNLFATDKASGSASNESINKIPADFEIPGDSSFDNNFVSQSSNIKGPKIRDGIQRVYEKDGVVEVHNERSDKNASASAEAPSVRNITISDIENVIIDGQQIENNRSHPSEIINIVVQRCGKVVVKNSSKIDSIKFQECSSIYIDGDFKWDRNGLRMS